MIAIQGLSLCHHHAANMYCLQVLPTCMYHAANMYRLPTRAVASWGFFMALHWTSRATCVHTDISHYCTHVQQSYGTTYTWWTSHSAWVQNLTLLSCSYRNTEHCFVLLIQSSAWGRIGHEPSLVVCSQVSPYQSCLSRLLRFLDASLAYLIISLV